MQAFPHHYKVEASGGPEGDVMLSEENVESIASAPPTEFGGPGDRWSPESLLVAAVADCFILTFRAIARASKLSWTSLACDVTGTLDRAGGTMKFTSFDIHASLTVDPGTSDDKAQRLLEKAEAGCLITNSLAAEIHLVSEVSQAA